MKEHAGALAKVADQLRLWLLPQVVGSLDAELPQVCVHLDASRANTVCALAQAVPCVHS